MNYKKYIRQIQQVHYKQAQYKKGIAAIAAIIIGLIVGVVIVVGIVATQKKAPVSQEPLFIPGDEIVEEEEEVPEEGIPVFQSYQNDELSFSFEFPEKYGEIRNFGDFPLITKGTTGEALRGYITFDPWFYFAGISRDYTAERGGDLGESKDENCAANANRVTQHGDEYEYQLFTDPDGFFTGQPGNIAYLAFFKLESGNSQFPCLGFVIIPSTGTGEITEAEFLEVMDTVKIY